MIPHHHSQYRPAGSLHLWAVIVKGRFEVGAHIGLITDGARNPSRISETVRHLAVIGPPRVSSSVNQRLLAGPSRRWYSKPISRQGNAMKTVAYIPAASILIILHVAATADELGTDQQPEQQAARQEPSATAKSAATPSISALTNSEPARAVAPFDTEQAKRYQEAWAKHLELPVELTNSIGMRLVLIPPGEFMMGSSDSEADCGEDEGPRHGVRITRPFFIGMHEVTQGQYEAVMRERPWKGRWWVKTGSDYPASCVSWEDAEAFCERLSEKEGRTYRLPTEAEWEYTCRAGTTTDWSFGPIAIHLGEYAWFAENARNAGNEYAHVVGQKQANAWRLHDMHGNVAEWCGDWYGEGYYAGSPATDPTGPETGSERVFRGGTWDDKPYYCRVTYRADFTPDMEEYFLGFRVALDVAEKAEPPKEGQ